MKKILLLAACFASCCGYAQTYNDSMLRHRQHYKEEFITDANSPLKAEDTGYLRFFAPDEHYRVIATFTPAKDTVSFLMPTHSGVTRRYRVYGTATFYLPKQKATTTLEIYQSLDLIKHEQYKDHLFLPYKDGTNYEETYGGGRYIDLSTKDIKDGSIIIDFNKAYNPYCAYADGYNCPIPPAANKVKQTIKAGEMMYGKKHE